MWHHRDRFAAAFQEEISNFRKGEEERVVRLVFFQSPVESCSGRISSVLL